MLEDRLNLRNRSVRPCQVGWERRRRKKPTAGMSSPKRTTQCGHASRKCTQAGMGRCEGMEYVRLVQVLEVQKYPRCGYLLKTSSRVGAHQFPGWRLLWTRVTVDSVRRVVSAAWHPCDVRGLSLDTLGQNDPRAFQKHLTTTG